MDTVLPQYRESKEVILRVVAWTSRFAFLGRGLKQGQTAAGSRFASLLCHVKRHQDPHRRSPICLVLSLSQFIPPLMHLNRAHVPPSRGLTSHMYHSTVEPSTLLVFTRHTLAESSLALIGAVSHGLLGSRLTREANNSTCGG